MDTVKGKVGDALREHLAAVMRNRQLTELVRDVPLDVEIADLARQAWDRERVHALFDNLQFRVLRERLFATLTAAEPEAEEGFEVSTSRLGVDEVAEWLEENARDGSRVGVSFRGSWGRGTGLLTGLALAAASGRAAYIQPDQLTENDERALAAWLADPAAPKAVHDVKGPLLALRQHGWTLAGITSDTQLAAYLALPGQRSFDLADLALRYLHRELVRLYVGCSTGRRGQGGQPGRRPVPRPQLPRSRVNAAAVPRVLLEPLGDFVDPEAARADFEAFLGLRLGCRQGHEQPLPRRPGIADCRTGHAPRSRSHACRARSAISTSSGTSRTSSVSWRLRITAARCSRSASPTLPLTVSTPTTSASNDPNSRTHLAAVFSPTPGMPGRLSLGSPRSAAKSGYWAGVNPYFATTSSGVDRVRSLTPLRG